MRIFSSLRQTAAGTRWTLMVLWAHLSNAVNYNPIVPPNLDLSQLGQVALTGDFDAISLYTYREQNENRLATNGSQSIIVQLPNGDFAAAASADADITSLCPFVMNDGTLAGIVVTGNFTSLGGVEAHGIALYDPATSKITPLPGLSGQVAVALCDQDTNTVYVGGDFKGANSTNAIAWVGSTGWANLPFAGFNGPVTSIVKSSNGKVIFGGSFTGLGNTTTPKKKDQQIVNLSTANITSRSSTSQEGFRDPKNIVCKTQGQDGAGNTWLLKDKSPGFWRADLNFGFEPSLLRVWNTHYRGYGTKMFRFTAIPLNGIMNFTYTDPTTGKDALCDARCPLSADPSVKFQDFRFVNTVGMNAFQVDVSDWYGKGGGLDGIELFQDDIYAYAVGDLNEPACANIEFASQTTRTGPWVVSPSANSTSQYLSVHLTGKDIKSETASVVFEPDIKQSGNYSVTIYTPGCIQDSTCANRGIANITGVFAAQNQEAAFSQQEVYQTNNFDKYDEIYYGYVDANSDAFRPRVTVTPPAGQDNITLVAQRVRFTLVNSTGGLNGLFEFDPYKAIVDSDFQKSLIDHAGTALDSGATVTALAVSDNVTFVAGNFSASSKAFQNVFSISNTNTTVSLNGGLDAEVSTVATIDSVLYLGGNFSHTVKQSVSGLNNVAIFNQTTQTWQALGAGVNGRVDSIVPLILNVTDSRPETCITINGDFDRVEAFGSNKPIPVRGLAVWVPSRQNWLQNLASQSLAVNGRLSTWTTYNGSIPLLAGTLAVQDTQSRDAVTLTTSPLRLNSVKVDIQPRQVGQSSIRKRAINGQNVTGVVTGLFYNSGDRNITILGGHFTANSSNGTMIDNLAIVDQAHGVTGVEGGLDADSVFLALATQGDLLYAGGTVSGKINGGDVDGLIIYNLRENNYPVQPPPFGGNDVAVNTITVRPDSDQVYVGGTFDTAGSLSCPSVCMFQEHQWNPAGNSLGGSVAALAWQGKNKLLAGGNLTVNGNATSLANYDAQLSKWTALNGASSEVPGPVTALSPANGDASQFWVAGKSSDGSAFLMKYDGSKFLAAGKQLGKQTIIRGLSVLQLMEDHADNSLVDRGIVLLITGALDLPGFGSASAALFNGTTFTPFILSTSSNGPGSLSQLFSEKTIKFKASSKHTALGLVVLIALACALGAVFLLVVAGIIIERYRRRREGYSPAPTAYVDKTSNMGRIPPEFLFGRLGQQGRGDAPML